MDKKILTVSVLVFTFLLTPALVLAQSSAVDFIWVRTFGFERQWLNNPNQLIVNALLPAVAIYAIFLGMMRAIRISYGMGNIEHLIAVVVMLAALFTGGIGWISGWLSFLGQFSVAVFILLFLIGIGLYSWGFWKRGSALASLYTSYKHSARSLERQIRAVNIKIKKATEKAAKLEREGKEDQADKVLDEEVMGYKEARAELEEDLRKLRKSMSDAQSVGE